MLKDLTKYDWLLACLFVVTLPLVNPWVRGDGVGYYAYARSLLIEHRLNFEQDWKNGNDTFRSGRINVDGRILPDQYTHTGRIRNIWTVGPSLLWLPFLFLTHAGVLVCNLMGSHIPANGFSSPYLTAMAISTGLYGFLAVWISFRLARRYFDERWAFLAALGIWWASSLPVYMYLNPSWSHAHSAFVVALFLWYWQRTRGDRSAGQWVLLGLLSGLMVNVYYPNGVLLLIPLLEALASYRQAWGKAGDRTKVARMLGTQVLYVAVCVFSLLPTFISRYVIFGSPLQTGYMPARTWNWSSPHLWDVLFSADHGLLCWTPIVALALGGMLLLLRVDRFLAVSSVVVFTSFYLVIAFYPDWDGIASFGNRFFVSLSVLFVLGLAAALAGFEYVWKPHNVTATTSATTALLILWNLGLIFQWGTHLIPARGPISWRTAATNQVTVVPVQAGHALRRYFLRRGQMMKQIEAEDSRQLKETSSE